MPQHSQVADAVRTGQHLGQHQVSFAPAQPFAPGTVNSPSASSTSPIRPANATAATNPADRSGSTRRTPATGQRCEYSCISGVPFFAGVRNPRQVQFALSRKVFPH